MHIRLVVATVALGFAALAHGQDGPETRRTLWALPSTSCVANNPADEAVLRRSIEGLRNISPTRAVWVTCSLPAENFRSPDDALHVMHMTIWASTELPRVTVPCRGAVNVGSRPDEFVYFWDEETATSESYAIVGIEPETNPPAPHRTFAMMCKIPQLSALREFQVDLAQTSLQE